MDRQTSQGEAGVGLRRHHDPVEPRWCRDSSTFAVGIDRQSHTGFPVTVQSGEIGELR
jgi:hypothetical protein